MRSQCLLRENFPNEHLFLVSIVELWYADMVNYLVICEFPLDMSHSQRAKIRNDSKYFDWDTPHLWKFCSDQIIRRCVPEHEFKSILTFCHEMVCGGHFSLKRTARKIFNCGLF